MENLNISKDQGAGEGLGELNVRLGMLEQKLDQLLQTMNTIKKIIFWVVIVSVVLMILPLVGLLFTIPTFISTFSDYSSLLQ